MNRLRALENLEQLWVGKFAPPGRAGPHPSPIDPRRKNQPGAMWLWEELPIESELDGPRTLIVDFPLDAVGIEQQPGPPVGRRPLSHGAVLDSNPIQESVLEPAARRHIGFMRITGGRRHRRRHTRRMIEEERSSSIV